MGCHRIDTPDGQIKGWICLKNIYFFKGYTFEFHDYLGPQQLRKKDLEPVARVKSDFWTVATEFAKIPKKGRRKFLISG